MLPSAAVVQLLDIAAQFLAHHPPDACSGLCNEADLRDGTSRFFPLAKAVLLSHIDVVGPIFAKFLQLKSIATVA